MSSRVFRAILVSVLLTVGFAAATWAGGRFEVVVLDDAGEGLHDPAAWAPGGGNSATTLGEARRRVVEFALGVWTEQLDSPVPIRVGISFDPMGGEPGAAVLGFGGPTDVFRDFVGAPAPATWYVAALADRLAGVDLAPGDLDLTLEFNTDVDGPVVLGDDSFYYGLDGDAGTNVSLFEVALHEIAHGLGFTSFVNPDTGAKLLGYDDAYLAHLVRAGPPVAPLSTMTDAERLTAFAAEGELQWQGAAVAARAAGLTAGATPEGRVVLETIGHPGNHFHSEVSPDPLLEAFYLGSAPDFGLTRAALQDLGWGAGPDCSTP